MRDKYQQAKFEQYSEQMGYRDFEEGEPDDDGRTRYRNPGTQGRWNFWVASRDALALQPSASAEPTVEQAIEALKIALRDSKGWTLGYAEAIIRDAIDRKAEASATGAEPDGNKITEALENYRCANFQDEDGGLPLSDALAAAFGDRDIGRATQEIQLIADAVWEALATPTSAPVQAEGPACPMCHGKGWHWMPWADLAGVEPPPPKKVACAQCAAAPVHEGLTASLQERVKALEAACLEVLDAGRGYSGRIILTRRQEERFRAAIEAGSEGGQT